MLDGAGWHASSAAPPPGTTPSSSAPRTCVRLRTISASAFTQMNRYDISFRGALPDSTREGNTNAIGFSLSQPVFNWNNIMVYKEAGFRAAQAEAAFSQATQDLIVRVSQAYFDVLLAQDLAVVPILAVMPLLAMSLVLAGVAAGAEPEWPRFRGPNGTGLSEAKTIPVSWTEADYNWKIKLPGIGHSSPVLWGGRIFLLAASGGEVSRIMRPSSSSISSAAGRSGRSALTTFARSSRVRSASRSPAAAPGRGARRHSSPVMKPSVPSEPMSRSRRSPESRTASTA